MMPPQRYLHAQPNLTGTVYRPGWYIKVAALRFVVAPSGRRAVGPSGRRYPARILSAPVFKHSRIHFSDDADDDDDEPSASFVHAARPGRLFRRSIRWRRPLRHGGRL